MMRFWRRESSSNVSVVIADPNAKTPYSVIGFVQLFVGLGVFGFSLAMILRSTLGNPPWDVLHQGLVDKTGLGFGWIIFLVSVLVLFAWIPLKQPLGVGTVSNAVLVGPWVEVGLAVIPTPTDLLPRIGLLVAGVVLNGIATAAYIGARMGPGPRDGLMTGLVRTTGLSVRVIRTTLELLVLLTGWLLGGLVGVGTIVFAMLVGPITQQFLPMFTRPDKPAARPPTEEQKAN